jgi:hypothetical protein
MKRVGWVCLALSLSDFTQGVAIRTPWAVWLWDMGGTSDTLRAARTAVKEEERVGLSYWLC